MIYSYELETQLLAGLLKYPEKYLEISAFISEKDFNSLWNAMDIDHCGEVNAVDFIVFLSACGPEFDEVYRETERLPKTEKLKLAARRLTNISRFGERGVRRNEIKLERRSRELKPTARKSNSATLPAESLPMFRSSSSRHSSSFSESPAKAGP